MWLSAYPGLEFSGRCQGKSDGWGQLVMPVRQHLHRSVSGLGVPDACGSCHPGLCSLVHAPPVHHQLDPQETQPPLSRKQLCTLHTQQLHVRKQVKASENKLPKKQSMDARFMRTHNYQFLKVLVIMFVSCVVSWLPFAIWYAVLFRGFTVSYLTPEDRARNPLPKAFHTMAIFLGLGNSAVNPLIFGLGHVQIRRLVKRTIKSFLFWRGTDRPRHLETNNVFS